MRLIIFCLALGFCQLTFADRKGDDDISRVDEIHGDWSEWVLETANRVDGFFSNTQASEADQKTRLRAFVRVRYDGNEGAKLSPGVRARVSLPMTENRLKLILGDDEDEGRINDLDSNQQNISLQIRGPRETALKQVRFDIGIRRRDGQYQPHVRARHSKAFKTGGPWVPRLTNSFCYFTKSKFEYRGQADFDRVIGSDYFFRPSTVLRWYENNSGECDDGWCLDQYFSLYEKLRRSKAEAIAYDVEVFLRDKPELTLHDAVLKVRYRRMTKKKWLFWELEPAVHFPSDYDHDTTFRFTVRLEGIFGYDTTVDINENFMPVKAPWQNDSQPAD
ncbi:MAG TPA: hypothetical protein DG761_02820 [Gammaproteobacteria bacterium]|nr:hypothetical protein [Gammaproteobacteria bacterium]